MNHTSVSGASRLLAAAAILSCSLAAQQPLTFGNLVVVRIGDGTAALTNASTPTFVDEYTPAGTFVQSIAMPIAASGTNRALTNSGSATSEGFLNVSANGLFLTIGGYDAAPGLSSVATSAVATANRVVGRIDITGAVDTSTALTDAFDTKNIRSVFSDDGNRFWLAGSAEGVRFVSALGATSSTPLGTGAPTNLRVISSYFGDLYVSSTTGTFQGVSLFGSGLPTTQGQAATLLNGFPTAAGPSNYDFFFANPDTLYLADDRTSGVGGIQKWTQAGGVWTLQYTLALSATSGCRGLTGFVQNGQATLWATANTGSLTEIVSVVDTGPSSVVTSLVPAAANTAFRGIRFLGLPSNWTRAPHSCGIMDLKTTGNGQIGTDVTTQVVNPQVLPLIGYGTTPFGIPFCNCTLGHEFLMIVGPTPVHTLSLPNNPGVVGVQILIQAIDFLAPGGCPDPTFTLTDTLSFTVQ